MQFLAALIILFLSSSYVLFLSHIAFSNIALQRAIVLPLVIITILIILYRYPRRFSKEFVEKWGNQFFLFWGTIFVQLLVISTGGLQSPFLILIYLFMMTISFIFSFRLAVVFLSISLAVIFVNLSFAQNITDYFIHDPSIIVLHIVSLIPIIPLAFLISRQYHFRDMLISALHTKVKTDEVIFEHLQELIIITDAKLAILSVNDAVEQILQKSRSELLGYQLFNVLMLRDANGKLATKQTFFSNGDLTKQPKNNKFKYALLLTSLSHREVTVQVQSTKGFANTIQISFIFSFTKTNKASQNALVTALTKAKVKHDALSEQVKKVLLEMNNNELTSQMALLHEIQSDIYNVLILEQYPTIGVISRIDIAKLVKQTVSEEQNFAKIFHVALDFTIKNFGEKDVAPLTVKNYHVKPEELTGPFFTITTDVNLLELLIKKLLDMAVFLSSGQTEKRVSISIKRGEHETFVIQVTVWCEQLFQEELPDFFVPSYGKLYDKTQLHAGSGFEGFLVKTVSNVLTYDFDTQYTTNPNPQIIFTLSVKKSLTT